MSTTLDPPSAAFDLDRPWDLHPRVSLRREPFGALVYHFDTRRLSFLKSLDLLAVVESLGASPTAGEACRAAGIDDERLPAYRHALGTLAASGMICERRPR